jgi:hypothetical protein
MDHYPLERINRRRLVQTKPDRLERQQAAVEEAWQKQEARTAEAVPGGRVVPGSGCSTRASRKSDVEGTWVRAEDKTTGIKARGFRVTREHLAKIEHEASNQTTQQIPAFVFGFDNEQDWMAFRLNDAATLMAVVEAVASGDVKEARELAEMLTGRRA